MNQLTEGKLNGLDLFSGYGGISLALKEYARPIMYCEVDRFAQAILLSRMDDETIPVAPIWDDVETLDARELKGLVDIVWGGFPCQDISTAGKFDPSKDENFLDKKRSGLFREVVRICKEASPEFVFLENVPAIRTRGSIEVQEALASIGFDCRWGVISASEVGANHKRERWFCLGKKRETLEIPEREGCEQGPNEFGRSPTWGTPDFLGYSDKASGIMANSDEKRLQGSELFRKKMRKQQFSINESCEEFSDAECFRTQIQINGKLTTIELLGGTGKAGATSATWWSFEPPVGRVVNGLADRSHRIKALGNGVVPLQVKTAFEILMGIR